MAKGTVLVNLRETGSHRTGLSTSGGITLMSFPLNMPISLGRMLVKTRNMRSFRPPQNL
jgi:hypothetical protein